MLCFEWQIEGCLKLRFDLVDFESTKHLKMQRKSSNVVLENMDDSWWSHDRNGLGWHIDSSYARLPSKSRYVLLKMPCYRYFTRSGGRYFISAYRQRMNSSSSER